MNRTTFVRIALCVALGSSTAALAQQSNVSPVHKFSWGENIGFMNWRDAGAPPGSQGAVIGTRVMSGFIWGENVGWINLGDGTPAAGKYYGNLTGADFGVNIDAVSRDLFGLAWGENIGWINFDTRAALGPFGQQARLDGAARRLRGYAWGENVGWINLDSGEHFVSLRCIGDFNGSGAVSPQDLFDFLAAFFAVPTDLRADINGNGTVTVQDLFDFLAAFFSPCA